MNIYNKLENLLGTITLLTGPRGCGKTTQCLSLLEQTRAAGLDVAGLISLAVFAGGQKVGIEALDLRANQARRLAQVNHRASLAGLSTPGWIFDEAVMAWGNAVLQAAPPCDWLIIDELGPLEWEQGRGWLAGLAAVDSGAYRRAVVVVRPELLPLAQARWPLAVVIELEAGKPAALG
jgi:hypothetical protein